MHEQHSHKLLLKREMKVDVTSRFSIMNDVTLLKEAGDFVHDDGIAINYSITDFRVKAMPWSNTATSRIRPSAMESLLMKK